ncbi:MAG TPA: hypothetical protein VEV17_05545 [Bryobacteraceae bacterium]|nr:hypothetical protein [Bryobacteraceae bacterium]
MRPWLLLIAAALACAETPKLAEPYGSLVELAHATPPEFAADALLRLAESGKITDRDARRDLIEQAFTLAAGARFPVRLRGVPGTLVDTRSGFLSQAYDLKLDALSLESRAVQDMLRIDPAQARKLIQEIPPPVLAPLTCDDALFYDVADFYQAVGAIANSAFTDKERAKEEHVNFLLDYIGQATSGAQFLPLAQMIQSAGVTTEQREILWTKFNGMLASVSSDDRSLSALFVSAQQGPAGEMQDLVRKSLKSAGCPNDVGRSAVPVNLLPTVPAKSDTTPKLERYWQSAEAQRLLEDGKRLRIAADGRLLTEADRSAPEWQQRLADYLSALAAWGPAQEKSETDYYNEKCLVYIALVELIPPGPQRDKTLDAFVDFVSSSGLQQQSPAEWFLQANAMLERMRPLSNGDSGKVLETYERSGNPILALETSLEKTLGVKASAWTTGTN